MLEMKRILTLLLSAFLAFGVLIPHSAPVGAAETEDLYAAINAYRQGLGLAPIPLSPQLTAVAQAHVQDLIANSTTDPNYTGAECVPHSWSNQGAWTGGCYKFADASSYPIMWNKPGEISGYGGTGFEILFGANGFTVTAAQALQSWQADGPHNDVIVNQGVWKDLAWQAIGVWVQDGWAAVWFGVATDPGATLPAAAQPADTTAGAPQPDAGGGPAPPADTAGTTTQPVGAQEGQPADTTGTTTQPEGQPAGTTDNGNAAAGTTGGTGAAGDTATTGAAAAPACGDAEEVAFLGLINAYRAQNGLEPLAMSPTLTTAARDHSQDMGTQNYFDHTGLNGSTFSQRIAAAGYPGGTLAENIFAGDQTAQGAFESWRNSPGHNANMLNPAYKAIGIGRANVPGSDWGWYWTTTFGDQVDGACGGAAAAAQPAANGATTNGQTEQPQNGTTDTGQNGQAGTGNTGANDPAGADTDGDGLLDESENALAGTDPNVFDTDGGGVGDGDEWVNGKNPLDPADDNGGGAQTGGGAAGDADGDGLFDDEEAFFGTNPNAADSDGDSVNDLDELFNGTDPLDPNSV
jgi:uncharacterized protein YkwD